MAVINSSRFDFSDVISKELTRYGADVFEEVFEAVDEVSKEAVKKLKAESPKGATGKYAKGWTRKLDRGRVSAGAVVYGKTASTYAVAHLLEHGHVKRNGTGRTFGKTKEIVHIEPVEQWAVDELEDRIISKLDHNMRV